jgi:hypothetical protein
MQEWTMADFAFPTDLIAPIKSRWEMVPEQQFELPEDHTLQRLLETCYHASFRTSEQRAVQCVVAYASSADVPPGALRLSRPVVLTDSELVRLSPVTQHRQTVIGCGQMDGVLCIWGFFDYGHAWVQHSSGDPPAVPIQLSDFPPDCLTITIERPGALTISQGRTRLVRLRDGRVIFPQEDPFQSDQNPLGRFFHQMIDELLQANLRRGLAGSGKSTVEQRTLLNLYRTSILAILERIRLTRHGGSVVISLVPLNEQLAHVTYAVSEDNGLAGEFLAYGTLNDSLRQSNSASEAAEVERCHTQLDLHRTSRQLVRGISRISFLAAADGAVLLDGHLRIQGFGVRFPALLSPGTTVLDALSGSTYPCDQWGLRHQSVFSLCHKCEQAIGLIVSQDGDVKAVKADNGVLMFWDGILD